MLSDSISADDLKIILDILKSTKENIIQISCFKKAITQISQIVEDICTTSINLNTLPSDHLKLLLSQNYRRLWDSEDRLAKRLKREILDQINQKNQNPDKIKDLLKKLGLIHENAILFTVTLPNNNPIYYATKPRGFDEAYHSYEIPKLKEFKSLHKLLSDISRAVSLNDDFNSSFEGTWLEEMTDLKKDGRLRVFKNKNPEYYVLVELESQIINFKVTNNINENELKG